MSKIEWTEITINPFPGCSKVSEGCLHCYAEPFAQRLKDMGHSKYDDVVNSGKWTGKISFDPSVFDKVLRRKKQTMYFVQSMGDVFYEKIPIHHVYCLFEVIRQSPQHVFQILTKREDRMQNTIKSYYKVAGIKRYLPNLWLGVTVESDDYKDRITTLLRTPAAVRFVSAEPLLSDIDFTSIPYHGDAQYYLNALSGRYSVQKKVPDDAPIFDFGLSNFKAIDQIIIGCESGPRRRPCDINWMLSIAEQCREANVPLFTKQIDLNSRVEKDINEFPEPLRRREYPK